MRYWRSRVDLVRLSSRKNRRLGLSFFEMPMVVVGILFLDIGRHVPLKLLEMFFSVQLTQSVSAK